MSKCSRNRCALSLFSKSHISGAVFKKLMAEMRKRGMYPYSSNLRLGRLSGGRRVRKIGRSRGEVADTIERFIDGICSRYEWDDFCSVPIIDLHLDAIRLRCASLAKE